MSEKTNENMKILRKNMVLNSVKNIMGLLFPLITFPYISRVLGVENIGRYNFSNSVINYFVIIAGLGINGYAIREGVKFRNDPVKLKKLSDELFSINMISTAFAYCLLGVFLILIPKFHSYMALLLILSLQIFFRTIGIEWVYSIYEDYLYITIRTIIFQFISLITMFLFVRGVNDTPAYAVVTVISMAGSNILNFIHSKKYCHIGLTLNIDWNEHLRPILILFATSAMINIYVSSDITILGFLCDDRTVGIYSVSTKVYSIVKTILSSVIVVSIPRLSFLLGERDFSEFRLVSKNVYGTMLTFLLPAVTGIITLRRFIVLLLAGESFESATSSLFLLCIALIFCFGAYFWGQCIIIPLGLENVLFKSTVLSSVINIILNFILIPFGKEIAAAITTIISEGIVFFWCAWIGRKYVKINGIGLILRKIVFGCFFIVLVDVLVSYVVSNLVIHIALTVILSVVCYVVVEIILKNEIMMDIVKNIVIKNQR